MIAETNDNGTVVVTPSNGMCITNNEIYLEPNKSITVPNTDGISSIYEVFPANIPNRLLSDELGQEFWKGFFRDGRTDYSYAFVNSGAVNIVPPKAIDAKTASYMLMNCTKLVDASGIIINITSEKPTCVSLCMGCLLLTHPPQISFSPSAHVVRSYVCTYTNCFLLQEAVIWLGDGTQSAAGERTDMANCFLNCNELQDLAFIGKGSPKNLDLSSCKKLTVASMRTLENALMDVSNETAGTYEIAINSEIDGAMSEELKTAFNTKGWTLIVKDEENEEGGSIEA